MMRVNWWMLVLISMALLAGELVGAALMGYLMAWGENRRANTANGRTGRTGRTIAGTDGAARSSFAMASEDMSSVARRAMEDMDHRTDAGNKGKE